MIKPELRLQIRGEFVSFLQCLALIIVCVFALFGYLRYVAAYPNPLTIEINGRANATSLSPSGQARPLPPLVSPGHPSSATSSIVGASSSDPSEDELAKETPPPLSSLVAPHIKANATRPKRRIVRPEMDSRFINQVLQQAHMLFEDGRYSEALAQCDAVLTKDPRNSDAVELKNKIETVINILKP